MLLRGKLALFNFTDKFFHRTEHGLLHVGVAFDEFRHEVVKQAEHIVDHQHLPVALQAGADANGRNG